MSKKLSHERLLGDAAKSRADRLERKAANGLSDGDLMARIRDVLPVIKNMRGLPRDQRPTWEDIGSALSEQGLKTRKGEPLTALRLTSLIDAIQKQDAARELRSKERKARGDLASTAPPNAPLNVPPGRRPQLSNEVKQGRRKAAGPDATALETEIRKSRFEQHDDLFKE